MKLSEDLHQYLENNYDKGYYANGYSYKGFPVGVAALERAIETVETAIAETKRKMDGPWKPDVYTVSVLDLLQHTLSDLETSIWNEHTLHPHLFDPFDPFGSDLPS